jgi:hypothetical protein
LSKRIGGHRDNYKNWLKGVFSYVTSFEIIKYDDAYIELVEGYPCNTKAELERREGQVMRDTENCCNKYIAGRTKAEWFQDNKEKLAERMAKYYQDNKEKLAERMVKYQQENKEKIAEYMAKYYQENKEKLAERDAKRYQANKEEIAERGAKRYQANKEKLSEKVQCDCGSEVTKQYLTRHCKTKKHQNYLLTLNQD